jgi:putative addiction module CopG family antidote
MSVTLTPHTEALIQQKLATGPYRDTDEVIERALQALNDQEQLERLRAMLQEGIDEDDRGEVDEWTPELRERLHQQALERYQNELRTKMQPGMEQLDRGEDVTFTQEWSAGRAQLARERAAAGETPSPDVHS